MARVLAVMLLVGCGGAAATTSSAVDDPCAEQAETATEAVDVHDRCASAGGEASDDERAYSEIEAALTAHRDGLGADAAVTDEDAMALADRVWAYLDRVASQLTDHALLDRAEDAAEALMRDRAGDGAREAASGTLTALAALHAQLTGATERDPCAEEGDIAREANEALERCRAEHESAP